MVPNAIFPSANRCTSEDAYLVAGRLSLINFEGGYRPRFFYEKSIILTFFWICSRNWLSSRLICRRTMKAVKSAIANLKSSSSLWKEMWEFRETHLSDIRSVSEEVSLSFIFQFFESRWSRESMKNRSHPLPDQKLNTSFNKICRVNSADLSIGLIATAKHSKSCVSSHRAIVRSRPCRIGRPYLEDLNPFLNPAASNAALAALISELITTEEITYRLKLFSDPSILSSMNTWERALLELVKVMFE